MININTLKKDLSYINLEYNRDLTTPDEFTYGLELEFVEGLYRKIRQEIRTLKYNWLIYQDPTVWEYIKEDFTKNKGGEVTSPIISNKNKIWEDLEKTCLIIKNANGQVDERVASHIHIGSQAFEKEEYLDNFLLIWSCYEDIINKFFAGEYINTRPYNKLSKNCREKFETIDFKFSDINKVLNIYSTSDPMKTYSVSFYYFKHFEYEKENTIEFRNIRGTLEEEVWQNNMLFLTRLIEFSKKISKTESQFLRDKYINNTYIKKDSYNSEQAIELANLIYDNELEKMYFLKQYFKDFKESKDLNEKFQLTRKKQL